MFLLFSWRTWIEDFTFMRSFLTIVNISAQIKPKEGPAQILPENLGEDPSSMKDQIFFVASLETVATA
jgi:hypothetical protein